MEEHRPSAIRQSITYNVKKCTLKKNTIKHKLSIIAVVFIVSSEPVESSCDEFVLAMHTIHFAQNGKDLEVEQLNSKTGKYTINIYTT